MRDFGENFPKSFLYGQTGNEEKAFGSVGQMACTSVGQTAHSVIK
ncbi:MAG: hypothetical protein ACLRJX_06325 [[Ruminococcus] torques]